MARRRKNSQRNNVITAIVVLAIIGGSLYYLTSSDAQGNLFSFEFVPQEGIICKVFYEVTETGINGKSKSLGFRTSDTFFPFIGLNVFSAFEEIGELEKITYSPAIACEEVIVLGQSMKALGGSISFITTVENQRDNTNQIIVKTLTIPNSGEELIFADKDTTAGVKLPTYTITADQIDALLPSTDEKYIAKVTTDLIVSVESSLFNLPVSLIPEGSLRFGDFLEIGNAIIDPPTPANNNINIRELRVTGIESYGEDFGQGSQPSEGLFDINELDGTNTQQFSLIVELPEWTSQEGLPKMSVKRIEGTTITPLATNIVMFESTSSSVADQFNSDFIFTKSLLISQSSLKVNTHIQFSVTSNQGIRQDSNGSPITDVFLLKLVDGGTIPTPVPTGCGVGEQLSSTGQCVDILCGTGEMLSSTGQCVPIVCGSGEILSSTGQCDSIVCGAGKTLSSTGQCIDIVCGTGETLSSSGQCVTTGSPTDHSIKSTDIFYDYKVNWSDGSFSDRDASEKRTIFFDPLSFTETGFGQDDRAFVSGKFTAVMDFGSGIGANPSTVEIEFLRSNFAGADPIKYTQTLTVNGEPVAENKSFNVKQLKEINNYNPTSGLFTLGSIDMTSKELFDILRFGLGQFNFTPWLENCNETDQADGVCKKLNDDDKLEYTILTSADDLVIKTEGIRKSVSFDLIYKLKLDFTEGIPQDPCATLNDQALLNCIGDPDDDGYYTCSNTPCREPIDLCPEIFGVAPDGCPPSEVPCPDDDNDGTCDDIDDCKFLFGQIENNGCPIDVACNDSDNDSICDNVDQCPFEGGLKIADGCPKEDAICEKDPDHPSCNDRDRDRITDDVDACPDEFGIQKFNGCPDPNPPCPDNDKDGVCNVDDFCIDEEGTLSNGCPDKDLDRDGIDIPQDKCPTIAGTPPNGCPDSTGDADGDGILDDVDRCPTIKGTEQFQGCANECQLNPDLDRCDSPLTCSEGFSFIGGECIETEIVCDATGDFPLITDCPPPFELDQTTIILIGLGMGLILIIAVVSRRRK